MNYVGIFTRCLVTSCSALILDSGRHRWTWLSRLIRLVMTTAQQNTPVDLNIHGNYKHIMHNYFWHLLNQPNSYRLPQVPSLSLPYYQTTGWETGKVTLASTIQENLLITNLTASNVGKVNWLNKNESKDKIPQIRTAQTKSTETDEALLLTATVY